MINKEELFLYEYLKLCQEYFDSRNKGLLDQISEIYKRCKNTQNFIINTLPRNTRCYSGRISAECLEDISIMEEGSTFKFSSEYPQKVRVWCKDKNLLSKHIEHKLFASPGKYAILISELVNRKDIFFDYENFNIIKETGRLDEFFTGTLRESAKEFKNYELDKNIREVLIDSSVKNAEVIKVFKPFESINADKIKQEILNSLR
jgi:hypothetical protein